MYKKLSDTEMLIMKELWKIGKPITVKELAEWFSTMQKIEWKVQTIATFLTRMERKKFVASARCGKAKLYTPAISEEEVQSMEARGLLENHYGGSFKNFLVALSSGKISDEKADELEQWLKEQNVKGLRMFCAILIVGSGIFLLHNFNYSPAPKVLSNVFSEESQIKTIKVNYLQNQNAEDYYYEEYIDNFWWRGTLLAESSKKLSDKLTEVTFSGEIYKCDE